MTSRARKVMDGAAYWGAYYRYNPDIFAEEYLHLRLKLFQRIILVMMMRSTTFAMIAARGIGKTFISAVYCVIRCILYPGTQVRIVSGTRGQAINVLEKILYELKPLSPELCAEIDDKETKVNNTIGQIRFRNTSMIKVVTASDSARGNRGHVLIIDECRLVNKVTIDTILKKFLTLRRMPKYEALTDEERKAEYAKEKNLTLYLTSAYFKDSWVYTKCDDVFQAMLDESKRQFLCAFPYQLSIEEGLLDPEFVSDEMLESDFSEIRFSMEMEALFYGSAEGAFFDFDTVSKNRRIKYPMMPDRLSSKLAGQQFIKIAPKQNGEIRLLSADIALMSSRRHQNDASAIFINQMMPTKAGRYVSNIVYTESCEGMRTEEQALLIRKLFDEYSCDYIILDTNGIGLGVYDCLARDITDPDSGEVYPALSCCNNQEMADRCTVPGAKKVIWSIKASAQFNSDCAFLLREGFKSGRIRLLLNEYDGEAAMKEVKGYGSLTPQERLQMQLPYINTTLLIDELVNLEYEESAGKIRITERSGMRKDRYSSLSYNFCVATQLENKATKRQAAGRSNDRIFAIRPPAVKRGGRYI